MKKTLKAIVIVLIVLLVIGGAIGGYFIHRHNSLYIGGKEALRIALDDAGVSPAALRDKEVEFDHNQLGAWYDVDFDVPGTEYEYSLDAVTGEIIYSYSEPEHG